MPFTQIPPAQPDDQCQLLQFQDEPFKEMNLRVIQQNGNQLCAMAAIGTPAECGPSPTLLTPITTPEEFEACLCALQEYATTLNANVMVSGGPPYICAPELECPTPPPIPTLNQWGMIIMAAVLGLGAVIALRIMRRSGVVKPSS